MQPQYPPQFPVQPGYAPPQQQPYAPAQPAYPPQYAQPYAPPAPPPVPLPTGTLDAFYDQPSGGGGPAFKFMDANRQPQIGKSYAGIVARPITNADVRAQTDNNGRPQTYKDGRPKFVMVVPMMVQPSQEFPDGVAGWWVKGQARDELARAMAEAGAPAGPPEAGAAIRVTLVGVRPVPNMNPAYQYRIEYVRPNGAMPAQAVPTVDQAYPVEGGRSAVGILNPTQMAQPYAQPQPMPAQYAPPAPPQAMPPAPTAQPAPVAAQPPAQPAPAAQTPAGFTAEQAALFAQLTGQQPAA
ncbi:MAG TPA: hypothetical protein VF163_08235 [Micromonosporaceae bacterium]